MLVEAKGHLYLSRVMVEMERPRGRQTCRARAHPGSAGSAGVESRRHTLAQAACPSSAGVVSARSGAGPTTIDGGDEQNRHLCGAGDMSRPPRHLGVAVRGLRDITVVNSSVQP